MLVCAFNRGDYLTQWEDIKNDFGQIACNLAYTQRLDSAIAIGRMHLRRKGKNHLHAM